MYFLKIKNQDGTFTYRASRDKQPVFSPDEYVSKYEYLRNIDVPGNNNSPHIDTIIMPILDIIWTITTQVAQKLIRRNILFEETWMANLYSAFQYDIGKKPKLSNGDFAAFEQIYDEISFSHMENYLDILDLFGTEAKFDSSDFVKLLVTHIAVKNMFNQAAQIQFGNLQTDAKPFDPNKIP